MKSCLYYLDYVLFSRPLAVLLDTSRIRTQAMHRYLQVSPLQLKQLRSSDIMPDEDLLILGQTEHLQPDAHFIHTPRIHCSHNTHTRVLHSCTVTGPGPRSKVIPGMLRAAHVSLFLLFLSFLNLGTRRNLALRLRLEKSDS